ncbi:RICIN domain-containing protein [Streptomyces sp. NPDC057438]|uniref:RICIN domain-containing protein n=1 Tax=Streptomyces sp. NPDC057438 TaxID=3346133 RepID=UPI003677041F
MAPRAPTVARSSSGRGASQQSPGGSGQGDGLNERTDDGGDNQSWRLVPSINGCYQFVDVRNGWCADVKDASPADGAKVTQWPSTGGSNQG